MYDEEIATRFAVLLHRAATFYGAPIFAAELAEKGADPEQVRIMAKRWEEGEFFPSSFAGDLMAFADGLALDREPDPPKRGIVGPGYLIEATSEGYKLTCGRRSIERAGGHDVLEGLFQMAERTWEAARADESTPQRCLAHFGEGSDPYVCMLPIGHDGEHNQYA